jgi:hypothetical protein
MNKIFLFILVFILLFILLKFSCSVENFDANAERTCYSLKSSYKENIINQNTKYINSNKLNNYVDIILNPLFNSTKINTKINLETYLRDSKIPNNLINPSIKLISNIVNNNCIFTSVIEYNINGKSILIDIINTFNLDILRNSLLCVVPDKKTIDMLIQQILSNILMPYIEMCDRNTFIKYCEKQFSQDVPMEVSKQDLIIISESIDKISNQPTTTPIGQIRPRTPSRQRTVSQERRTTSPRQRTASQERRTTSPRQRNASQERRTPPRQRIASQERRTTPPRQRTASQERRTTPPRQRTASQERRTPPRQRTASQERRTIPPRQRIISEERQLAPPRGRIISEERQMAPPRGRIVSEERPRIPSRGRIVSEERQITPSRQRTVSQERPRTPSRRARVENRQELENFANELRENKKQIQTGTLKLLEMDRKALPIINNSSKYMDATLMSDFINNFNENSFGIEAKEYLKKILDQYRQTYNKSVNLMNIREFGNFVVIVINRIQPVINRILSNEDYDVLVKLVDEFKILRKIYYLLLHNYRIVQAYHLININMNKDGASKDIISTNKSLALQCCVRPGEKMCYNFGRENQPVALVFGYNNFGYVNSIKCGNDTPENRQLAQDQNKTLDQLLTVKYDKWSKISKDNKDLIYKSIINLLLPHGIKILDLNKNLGELRREFGETKISVNELNRTADIRENDITKRFIVDDESKVQLDLIDKLNNINEFVKILKNNGFSDKQVILNNNMNLDYIKGIVKTLLVSRYALINFNYENNHETLLKLTGIMNTNQTFNQIFGDTDILPRYYPIILQFVISTIQNNKIASVSNYDLNSVPINVIKYLSTKPMDSSLNICSVHDEFLNKLRRDRVLTNDDFLLYQNQIKIYCEPNKLSINEIKSDNIPLNKTKGLSVIERQYKTYDKFIKEQKTIDASLKNEVISDNILFNFMKNTYK